MTTEIELRSAPKVPWRIDIPEAPYDPRIHSARILRYSNWIYCMLTILAFILLEIYFSSPTNIASGELKHFSNEYTYAFLPAIFCTAGISWFLWIIKGLALQILSYIRGKNKIFVKAMSDHNLKVFRICEEAALPIHELWFPLCKIDHNVSSFYKARIWWRTSDLKDGYAEMEFYKINYIAGKENLVRFPKCSYIPDPSKPGTAKFSWGPDAEIMDPDFL